MKKYKEQLFTCTAALATVYIQHRKKEKCNLSEFDQGMVVGDRWVGLSISITAYLGFSGTTDMYIE